MQSLFIGANFCSLRTRKRVLKSKQSLVPLDESMNKLESQRSSAQSGHRSRDSALASSVSSVHTPPADGPHSHYFDPIGTPMSYSTKTYKGPFFNNHDLITPASYRPSPIMEAATTPAAASPSPISMHNMHSSPRAGAAASPERSNSPPIRPQTVSNSLFNFYIKL